MNLKDIKDSAWYFVLIAAGFAFAIASLPVRDYAMTSIGGGIFAIGFGEWFNHPRIEIVVPGAGKLIDRRRSPNAAGFRVNVLGVLLFALAVILLVYGKGRC